MLAVKAQHQTDRNRNDKSNNSQKSQIERSLQQNARRQERLLLLLPDAATNASGFPWGKNYHENLLFYHTSVTVPLMTNSVTPFRLRSFSLVESFYFLGLPPTGNYTTVFTFHSRKKND
jgi:hypothetical protein